jgi:hypothetical protein
MYGRAAPIRRRARANDGRIAIDPLLFFDLAPKFPSQAHIPSTQTTQVDRRSTDRPRSTDPFINQ